MSRITKGGSLSQINNTDSYWNRTIIPTSPYDQKITLQSKYDMAPDLLAYDLYGNSKFEWIILQFNNITDVALDFRTGKEIRIPDPNTLKGLV